MAANKKLRKAKMTAHVHVHSMIPHHWHFNKTQLTTFKDHPNETQWLFKAIVSFHWLSTLWKWKNSRTFKYLLWTVQYTSFSAFSTTAERRERWTQTRNWDMYAL